MSPLRWICLAPWMFALGCNRSDASTTADLGETNGDGPAASSSDTSSTGGESSSSGAVDESSTGAPMVPDGPSAFAIHCAACHGNDAEGTMLAPQVRNPVIGFAGWVVRHGRDEMPYPQAMLPIEATTLSDEELALVLEHLRSYEKPTDGEGLYLRFCANCHGDDASGGRVGQSVLGELDELDEAVREGAGGADYGNRTEYMPAWPTDELTDDDVAAIAAYLGALPGAGGEDDDDGDDDDGDDDDDDDDD